MRFIPLHNGMFTLIDDEDYPIVASRHWYAGCDAGIWYAKSNISGPPRRTISMHRFILGFPDAIVDHVDHDGLNNQRSNLRITDRSSNAANGYKHRDGTSRFKGVAWDKANNKWRASIFCHGKSYKLGRFESEEDAAVMYDLTALMLFGEFARFNFPI